MHKYASWLLLTMNKTCGKEKQHSCTILGWSEPAHLPQHKPTVFGVIALDCNTPVSMKPQPRSTQMDGTTNTCTDFPTRILIHMVFFSIHSYSIL